jgi:phytoene dehydrogenase-like protein
MMQPYDILVLGGGHNGLVCAGYLAKAGKRVCVLERRARIGGAVVTEEIIPGYKFDLGGSAHILIHHTPIVADLELESFGLEYIDVDPLFFAPYPDGSTITIWKDLDKTCESIAAVSRRDAEAYRRFVTEWRPIAAAMVEAFLHPPTMGNVIRHMVFGSKLGPHRMDRLTTILRSYGHVLREIFETPHMQGLIGWMAAQSGPPPTEPFSGPFALWHPMYHETGVKRPRGGSGMLTQALANMIQAHQGEVHVDQPVTRVLVENGRAVGAETEDGRQWRAKVVVSGMHLHTLLEVLPEQVTQQPSARLLKRTRIGNGFGMILRCAIDELPNYSARPHTEPKGAAHHRALQFICPSLEYLDAAYGDYLAGRPSAEPGLIAMTFSTVDETLAPEGKHVMFLWGQYYPYKLASGRSWDEIADQQADHMLATLGKYAPNMPAAVSGRLIETPLYLERELGLRQGNVMHLEMSLDQMFMMRPALSMSTYRGPVRGLYMTGASTHPGGGIMGAAGRNCAQVLLRDLRSIWPFGKHARS